MKKKSIICIIISIAMFFTLGAVPVAADEISTPDSEEIESGSTEEIVLNAPSSLVAKAEDASIVLEWQKVIEAEYYEICNIEGTSEKIIAKVNADVKSYTVKGLQNKKQYSYKVRAIKGSLTSDYSQIASATPTILSVGKVSGLKAYPGADSVTLKWSKTNNATQYKVYRYDSKKKKWNHIGTTSALSYRNKGLTPAVSYKYRVMAVRASGGQTTVGSVSATVSGQSVRSMYIKGTVIAKRPYYKNSTTMKKAGYLKPGQKIIGLKKSKGRWKFRASNGKYYWFAAKNLRITKAYYTKSDYSKTTKENFVNEKGYKSKTKYLVWINQYTQRVNFFKGSKGKWELIKTCKCATGKISNPTPQGVHKITRRARAWNRATYYVRPITYFFKGNAFHSRLHSYNGGWVDSTIGRPRSMGCVRLYDEDAKYVNKLPIGTTVVSY